MDPLPEQKTAAMKWTFSDEQEQYRPVVQVSLGCHVEGSALPKPDISDTWSAVRGIQKRFLAKPPNAEEALLVKFGEHVERWCKANLTPLPSDTDVSVETWLNKTIYPDWRKKELKEKWDAVEDIWAKPSYRFCKSFIKDECYDKPKYPRAINSRSDEFKCFVGPIFQAISEEVFKHEAFIKKIPINERPDYIRKHVEQYGSKVIASDYTAYEAHFISRLMELCEFQLYRYMTQNLPDRREFMRACEEVIGDLNYCIFKFIRVLVMATRMSGEMCTSLGNGFSNLMFMTFVADECRCTGVRGVVEGDDGLFTMFAGETGHYPQAEDFARLGLTIKPEWHDTIETASFCGIVFAREDGNNLADPRKLIAGFGWTSRKYARSRDGTLKQLLRAKALSMAYQYPGCPIAKSLANYGLRVTAGVNISDRIIDSMPEWPKRILCEALLVGAPVKEIGTASRLLVSKLWNIDVEQQLRIERYLDSLMTIVPLRCIWIDDVVPESWKQYFETYSLSLKPKDRQLNHPYPVWRPLLGSLNWPKQRSPVGWNRSLFPRGYFDKNNSPVMTFDDHVKRLAAKALKCS